MITILERRRTSDKYRTVFLIDGEAELASLPTSKTATEKFGFVAFGSAAIAIGDGGGAKLFMLNGADEWTEV